jgi:small subunit ribosomal protein S13
LARIAGVEIPSNKRVEVGLTYIYGIGRPKSKQILDLVKVDVNKKVKNLSPDEVARIRKHIEVNLVVEGDLKKQISQDIKRLMDINCFRGKRHKMGLPVRGQRTKTNARTRKGPRGSMIKRRKPAEASAS